MNAALVRPSGHLDLSSALLGYRGVLGEKLAAHLLRRAGFGVTPTAAREWAHRSPHEAVVRLLEMPSVAGEPVPSDIYDPRPDIMAARREYGGRRAGKDPAFRQAVQQFRRHEFRSMLGMQLWWLNRMLTTNAPLQEKMTFFFHSHFTTAALQKGVTPPMVFNQNQLYRRYALGNLRELTLAVSRDPAMLIYLDNARSVKAHPNENYARELMELFTLGIGNYSEEDVRQSARSFTGWSVDYRSGRFINRRLAHDPGTKTFLGETGNFDGSDIIRIIYEQPACARFWATALLNQFVYNNPEPQLVDAVARLIREHDFELHPIMATLLSSNLFFSPRAYRALVKSPVEFAVGAYQGLGLGQIDRRALGALRAMGQVIFYPPNVAGWPPGNAWMTSDTLIARENFLAALVNSPAIRSSAWITGMPMESTQAANEIVRSLLIGDAPPIAFEQLLDYLAGANTSALGRVSRTDFDIRVRGGAYLAMAMPTFQLA